VTEELAQLIADAERRKRQCNELWDEHIALLHAHDASQPAVEDLASTGARKDALSSLLAYTCCGQLQPLHVISRCTSILSDARAQSALRHRRSRHSIWR
jgi:hypothetical protein